MHQVNDIREVPTAVSQKTTPAEHASEDEMSLEDFQRWKVPLLKEYLRKWGLSYYKNKAELVSICYSAAKFKLPIKQTLRELQEKTATYQSFLKTDSGQLPDPFHLKTGWVDEAKGMELWPPTMRLEIQGKVIMLTCPPPPPPHLG